jgi:hypothetical protein
MTTRSSSELPTEILYPEVSAESMKRIMTIRGQETTAENEFQLADEDNDILRRRWKAGPQEVLVIAASAVMVMMLAFDTTMMLITLPVSPTS